jgi:hypothetical protein
VRIDQRREPHKTSARRIGGGKREGKGPHAQSSTAEKVFTDEFLFGTTHPAGQPGKPEHQEHVSKETSEGGVLALGVSNGVLDEVF